MSHSEDHDHDHTAPPPELELRVKALESLLIEKGLVDPRRLTKLSILMSIEWGREMARRLLLRHGQTRNFDKRCLTMQPAR